ncbi:skin secretory protein xP2-like [Delphinapterus leucas]|uniref:Skin secretory protein xP2-like n=1 Tax=Delphinapterus leucas TaxID=9749 RepID=A0A2Y9NRT9_DELLE|nr:skin secretory protein xP2-like [Delphinapterus leucas]
MARLAKQAQASHTQGCQKFHLLGTFGRPPPSQEVAAGRGWGTRPPAPAGSRGSAPAPPKENKAGILKRSGEVPAALPGRLPTLTEEHGNGQVRGACDTRPPAVAAQPLPPHGAHSTDEEAEPARGAPGLSSPERVPACSGVGEDPGPPPSHLPPKRG